MLSLVVGLIFVTGCSLLWNESKDKQETENEQEKPIVSEPTELTFIFADGDENGKAVWTQVVRRFNEEYSDISIKIVPGNGASYSEILKTKESIGEFPDIVETGNVASYIRAGMLAPLPEDITSLFVAPVEFDGEVYTAAPASANTCGIIYNKTYFSENNLQEPTSYEEFIELCKKIEEDGKMSPLVIGGKDIWHIGFWFNKAYGDQVLQKDENFIKHCYQGEKDFMDESFRQTLLELSDIFAFAQDGWSTTPDAQMISYLVEEKAAMAYTGSHIIPTLENTKLSFEFGWFAIPSPDGKIRMIGGNKADGLAISAKAASDHNKKAAAEEFIRFFFRKDNYSMYCEMLNIMIPTTKDAPKRQVSPIVQKIINTVESADYVGIMWNEEIGENELPIDFRDEAYATMIEYLEGKIDVETACQKVNESWLHTTSKFNPVCQ